MESDITVFSEKTVEMLFFCQEILYIYVGIKKVFLQLNKNLLS